MKAVIVVHLYGNPAPMDGILAVCARRGLILIEDAAESLGSLRSNRHTGTEGDFGVFSFNGNKIITTSGGGMLVARNPEHVARAKFLSTQAKDPGGHYVHSVLGYNYRMSNICAGIGRGQLERLEGKVARRREIAAIYERELEGRSGIQMLREPPGCRANRWLSTILLPTADARDRVVSALEERNIEARPVWRPLHEQKLYSGYGYSGGDVASRLSRRAVNLPSGTAMTPSDQERVVQAVLAAMPR